MSSIDTDVAKRKDLRDEVEWIDAGTDELRELRARILDLGEPATVANGIVGWIIAKQAGPDDACNSVTRSRYRKILRRVLDGEGDDGPGGRRRRHLSAVPDARPGALEQRPTNPGQEPLDPADVLAVLGRVDRSWGSRKDIVAAVGSIYGGGRFSTEELAEQVGLSAGRARKLATELANAGVLLVADGGGRRAPWREVNPDVDAWRDVPWRTPVIHDPGESLRSVNLELVAA